MRPSALYVVLFLSVYGWHAVSCQIAQTNSMEYQLDLDYDLLTTGRANGIDAYVAAWSVAAGVSVADFTETENYRLDASENLSACGSSGIVRVREYIQGPRAGEFTIDIKATENGLTQAEAAALPYAPSVTYEDSADWQIERDVHPCQDDFSANTRITVTTLPDLSTCAAVALVYPDAVASSDTVLDLDTAGSVTYLYSLIGPYQGGTVNLVVELTYDTLDEAVNDENRRSGGEFSFTMISSNDGSSDFTSTQIAAGDATYTSLVLVMGSPDLPCDGSPSSASPSPGSPSPGSPSPGSPSPGSPGSPVSSGASSGSDSSAATVTVAWTLLAASLLAVML